MVRRLLEVCKFLLNLGNDEQDVGQGAGIRSVDLAMKLMESLDVELPMLSMAEAWE